MNKLKKFILLFAGFGLSAVGGVYIYKRYIKTPLVTAASYDRASTQFTITVNGKEYVIPEGQVSPHVSGFAFHPELGVVKDKITVHQLHDGAITGAYHFDK